MTMEDMIPSQSTILPNPSIKDPCYVNAMSHLYRGELGRIMIWRQRLDITSNWAITTTTTIVSVSFGFKEMPHLIFFFNLVIVLAMLWIEARRYRFYDAFRSRVRLLEAHFMISMISQSEKHLEGTMEGGTLRGSPDPHLQDHAMGGARTEAQTELRVHHRHHPHCVDGEDLHACHGADQLPGVLLQGDGAGTPARVDHRLDLCGDDRWFCCTDPLR
jgi:hypothetical protein